MIVHVAPAMYGGFRTTSAEKSCRRGEESGSRSAVEAVTTSAEARDWVIGPRSTGAPPWAVDWIVIVLDAEVATNPTTEPARLPAMFASVVAFVAGLVA